ncbi:MAG: hypothetical protein ABIM31_00040 [candidate division WOR-3 bacterium]
MAKETFSSDKILKYLREVQREYETGGIWLARKLGRRWSYVCGLEPESFGQPEIFLIYPDYALFVENSEKFKLEVTKIIENLKKLME